MTQTAILLLIAFLESFVTILDERGMYFYCKEHLNFSTSQNLWLALTFGGSYVVAAWRSHWLASRIGEKRQLLGVIALQVAMHAMLCFHATPQTVFLAMGTLGLTNGLKWPVVEAYIGAGLDPHRTARALGRFNITWATAVPLSLVAAGPLTSGEPTRFFIVGGALNLVALALALGVSPRPAHGRAGPAARVEPSHSARLSRLLVASRWLMLGAYISVFVIAPLAPRIFKDLGCSPALSPATSGVLDVMRLAAFVGLGLYQGWRGQARWLVATMLALPAGFFMIILGPNITIVLLGELLFGFAAGMSYSSALYCAMVVKEASVDAGGGHESMIGLGFVIGPLAGLLGELLSDITGSHALGYLTAMGPVLLVCITAGSWQLAIGNWQRQRQT